MFQCPTSGFFLFYEIKKEKPEKEILFQCPTSGFFLFYSWWNSWRTGWRSYVSMPYFGLLPFLHQSCLEIKEGILRGFNALLRASFFSTYLWKIWIQLKQVFQCPTSGFFLFYKSVICFWLSMLTCFNALPRASSFSTHSRNDKEHRRRYLFQCPTSGFFLFYRWYPWGYDGN